MSQSIVCLTIEKVHTFYVNCVRVSSAAIIVGNVDYSMIYCYTWWMASHPSLDAISECLVCFEVFSKAWSSDERAGPHTCIHVLVKTNSFIISSREWSLIVSIQGSHLEPCGLNSIPFVTNGALFECLVYYEVFLKLQVVTYMQEAVLLRFRSS